MGIHFHRGLENLARTLLPERLKVPLRWLRFAIKQRAFQPYVKSIEFEGETHSFYIGDIIGHEWYGSGKHGLSPELSFIRKHMIRPGDVALDCGAHHGSDTLCFSKWVGPTGRVIAFEPSPQNIDILRRNVELNHLENVTCEHKALAHVPGTVVMTPDSNARVTATKAFGNTVDAIDIDHYLDQKPTFLKMDIEGFEVEALKGAQKVLATRPKIAMEIHTRTLANFHTNLEELFSLLPRDGYEFWIQWDESEQPVPYNMQDRIEDRVHLFAIPR